MLLCWLGLGARKVVAEGDLEGEAEATGVLAIKSLGVSELFPAAACDSVD